MLGSRLARRIVLPVLILIGVLIALLGWAAVRVADAQVQEELERQADRVAATLDEFGAAGRIVSALERLVGLEIAVGRPRNWPEGAFRVLERTPKQRSFPDRQPAPARYYMAAREVDIAARTGEFLRPIIWTGAVGLLVAAILGLRVARAIARPVKALADEARQFAAGEEVSVTRDGPGEIGELQESFAHMLVTIREGAEKLRESERFAALGRLAGGIAHELRNPLTAIRMAVETATDKDNEARKIAVAEIERLDRTLREMLDYVRPRKPRLADVALPELCNDVCSLLGPQCEHLGVALEVDAAEGDIVRADKDRLIQALLNLVLNAAQAQPRGGVVRLVARGRVIAVEDEGPGIPDEVRESLLQPFVTTKEAGIGLGLAVVKQVADEHGAELKFQTSAQGTTFTLTLHG